MTPGAARWGRAMLWLWLAALAVAGTWFRLAELAWLPGINGDEAWCGYQSWALLHDPGKVDWLTPTGPPLCPTYALPQALMLLATGPTPWSLRAVSMASGLLLFAAALRWGRPGADRLERAAFATLLYALPVNVAYSRFGWYSSQSCLVCYLACALAARRRSGAAFGAFVMALWVHPTNVFLLPMLVALHWSAPRPEAANPTRRLRKACGIALLAVAGVAAGIVWLPAPALTACRSAVARLGDAAQAGEFLRLTVELLSGSTVYRYLCRSDLQATYSGGRDLAVALAFGASVAAGILALRRRGGRRETAAAFAGLGLTCGAFYLVAGPAALRPHVERYGLCLIVPFCWTAVSAWRHALAGRSALLALGAATLASLALWDFQREYFTILRNQGNRTHETFRAHGIDPKWSALQALKEHRAGSVRIPGARPFAILAESWWPGWPLRFFAAGDRTLEVFDPSNLPPGGDQDLIRFDAIVSFSAAALGPEWRELPVPGQRGPHGERLIFVYVRHSPPPR